MPFGMCKSSANPQVAAATAAAQGVLTPMPCMPVVNAPWTPGTPGLTVLEQTALSADSTCQCAWTGTIEVVKPSCEVEVNQS